MIAEDILCLTPDGWKGWRELKAGTEICVFDLRSMCFRSEPVREVRFYPWNGFLLKIGSLLVTPDHPLLLRGRFNCFFSTAERLFQNTHGIRAFSSLIGVSSAELHGGSPVYPISEMSLSEVRFSGTVWSPVTDAKTFVVRGTPHFLKGEEFAVVIGAAEKAKN